jgi:threonine/homoserine/homoserine lactone efflux protein
MTALAISMLTAFWVVSFFLVVTPGADWAYAISAGMRDKAIAPAIVGMLFGYLMITLIVAAGVGALVKSVPAILTVSRDSPVDAEHTGAFLSESLRGLD